MFLWNASYLHISLVICSLILGIEERFQHRNEQCSLCLANSQSKERNLKALRCEGYRVGVCLNEVFMMPHDE